MNNDEIVICRRPEWISFMDIHELLLLAHATNKEKGLLIRTSTMKPEELIKHIGEKGECFVALKGEKLIGITAVRIVERNNNLVHGLIADQILVAVLPEYSGLHISSLLHQQVILFAQEHHITSIEIRTAYENKKMQMICKKWGFYYVDFKSFPDINHYTVVMMKWLNQCPYQKVYLFARYCIRKALVKIRYKPGKIRRRI